LEVILPALEGRLGHTTCPLTTIELYLDPVFPDLYVNLIQSIPRWTPQVKKLRLGCMKPQEQYWWSEHNQQQLPFPSEFTAFFPNDNIRMQFLEAVRKNFHLQVIELDIEGWHGDHDLNKSLTLLHAYGERNRGLQGVVNNPYALPMSLWPFILHIADRAGRDFVYKFMRNRSYE